MSIFRTFKTWIRVSRARREAMRRDITPREHDLDAPLIVSVTSYPKRFDVLSLTLMCLLKQTIRPDMVILWVAEDDLKQLPEDVLSMQMQGLKICQTEDIRSYKKLIPALQEMPNAYI